jgi:L,D-transpeptidase catalytic domain
MLNPRTLLLLFVLLVSATWFSFSGSWQKAKASKAASPTASYTVTSLTTKKLQEKAAAAAVFAQQKGYNSSVCFLIDMSVPSGQNRFFVYNLQKDSVLQSGLVTHGRCNQNWLEGRKYGNTVGCGCTSLGKYKIGYAYNGRFGLAYKLYGLDKTNDKAFERFVVLHAHDCVPATEVNDEICQSDGCPTVSPDFLQTLKPVITASKKPVLLWIYE